VDVGVGETIGEGERRRGVRVAEARLVILGPAPVQAASPRMVNIKNTATDLFFIIILNFQLHFPDGF
jgi:hypothetical protein